MVKAFYLFRYISWTAIIGSLLLFVVGALKTVEAFRVVINNYSPEDKAHLDSSDTETTNLIKYLKIQYIALETFIFAYNV